MAEYFGLQGTALTLYLQNQQPAPKALASSPTHDDKIHNMVQYNRIQYGIITIQYYIMQADVVVRSYRIL